MKNRDILPPTTPLVAFLDPSALEPAVIESTTQALVVALHFGSPTMSDTFSTVDFAQRPHYLGKRQRHDETREASAVPSLARAVDGEKVYHEQRRRLVSLERAPLTSIFGAFTQLEALKNLFDPHDPTQEELEAIAKLPPDAKRPYWENQTIVSPYSGASHDFMVMASQLYETALGPVYSRLRDFGKPAHFVTPGRELLAYARYSQKQLTRSVDWLNENEYAGKLLFENRLPKVSFDLSLKNLGVENFNQCLRVLRTFLKELFQDRSPGDQELIRRLLPHYAALQETLLRNHHVLFEIPASLPLKPLQHLFHTEERSPDGIQPGTLRVDLTSKGIQAAWNSKHAKYKHVHRCTGMSRLLTFGAHADIVRQLHAFLAPYDPGITQTGFEYLSAIRDTFGTMELGSHPGLRASEYLVEVVRAIRNSDPETLQPAVQETFRTVWPAAVIATHVAAKTLFDECARENPWWLGPTPSQSARRTLAFSHTST